MPYSSGVFTFNGSTVVPAVTATTISSADFNTFRSELETGLGLCLLKNGTQTVTANIPMAGYKFTGIGDASALTDYASANQVVDGSLTYLGASSAGSDAYACTAAISPGGSDYVTGAKYIFKADVANTGACTLNISSVAAKNIVLLDGGTPYNGAIAANQFVEVIYNGTAFVLQNPSEARTTLTTEITLYGSTTPGTQTYAVQGGYEVRVGDRVDFTVTINLSAKDGTTAGELRIGPLTHTASANNWPVSIASMAGWNLTNTDYQVTAFVAASTNYIRLQESNGATSTTLLAANFSGDETIIVSGTYWTA